MRHEEHRCHLLRRRGVEDILGQGFDACAGLCGAFQTWDGPRLRKKKSYKYGTVYNHYYNLRIILDILVDHSLTSKTRINEVFDFFKLLFGDADKLWQRRPETLEVGFVKSFALAHFCQLFEQIGKLGINVLINAVRLIKIPKVLVDSPYWATSPALGRIRATFLKKAGHFFE